MSLLRSTENAIWFKRSGASMTLLNFSSIITYNTLLSIIVYLAENNLRIGTSKLAVDVNHWKNSNNELITYL